MRPSATRQKKLLFLGSSCIYPKYTPQPMKGRAPSDRKARATNDAYALAKIAGIVMCKSYNRQHGTNFMRRHADNLYAPTTTSTWTEAMFCPR